MTSTKTLALIAAMLIAGAGFVAANTAYAQSGKKSARALKAAALGKSSRGPEMGRSWLP